MEVVLNRVAMKTRRTIPVLFAVILIVSALAFCLDFILSRPDRIEATRRIDEMLSVRDQLLRYELEHGSLPRTLEELVPRYVRPDQLVGDDAQLQVNERTDDEPAEDDDIDRYHARALTAQIEHPEEAHEGDGRQGLDDKVTRGDQDAAMPTAPAQQEIADEGDVVIPGNGHLTVGTV